MSKEADVTHLDAADMLKDTEDLARARLQAALKDAQGDQLIV